MDHQCGVGVVANWRRERDRSSVHVVPDAAPALCGLDRDKLGATVWDAHTAAPEICVGCATKTLRVVDSALAAIEPLLSPRGDTTPEDAERLYGLARHSLRELVRIVPAGTTADLVIYARACIVRNDPKDAHESVKRWREAMSAMGLLPQP